MKTTFKKDVANKKMFITREFAGSPDEVWKAWTDRSILDEWWAPKPWKAKTKSMDFREGGTWLYSMNGPDGEVHWAKATYLKIVAKKAFEMKDSFCDENGKENSDAPKMNWKTTFKPSANGTVVDIEVIFPSATDLEKIVEMGFVEGFNAAHENLDEILESKSVVRK